MTFSADWYRLWLLVAGFFCFHVIFEYLNEALVSLPGVPKSITIWSVAVQFACCYALPTILGHNWTATSASRGGKARMTTDGSTTFALTAELKAWAPYAALSAMVFAANGLSQYSTHYVEFTIKIVAKSSKLLPTMLIATLVGNADKFGFLDYTAAVLLCIGTAIFSYGGGNRAPNGGSSNLPLGLLALLASCVFDGFVPNAQQRLMHKGVSSATLMARTNAVGALVGVVSVILSGDGALVVDYAKSSPQVLLLVLGIGVSLAGSVLCYTDLVQRAGSVFTVGVATLRKSASLLVSYLLFPGKSFGVMRGVGLLLVSIGLAVAERQATHMKKHA